MKRDMDLIREILIKLEELPTYNKQVEIEIEGYSSELTQYQLTLLSEAKFIEVPDDGTSKAFVGNANITPSRLTMTGHDFLEAIRNKNVWKKTKDFIAKNGGGFVLTTVRDIAVGYLRKEMGLS